MKSNPVLPGGSLKSKPTWRNALGCSATSAFLILGDRDDWFFTDGGEKCNLCKVRRI